MILLILAYLVSIAGGENRGERTAGGLLKAERSANSQRG
jgi:hypothetical protein